MSLMIKGMEMPKPGAYTCELGVLDDNTAVLTIYTSINEPQKSYMLIPVPEHGRLIDADALAVQCDDPYWCVWLSDIDDAPTIIEADEVDNRPTVFDADNEQ